MNSNTSLLPCRMKFEFESFCVFCVENENYELCFVRYGNTKISDDGQSLSSDLNHNKLHFACICLAFLYQEFQQNVEVFEELT